MPFIFHDQASELSHSNAVVDPKVLHLKCAVAYNILTITDLEDSVDKTSFVSHIDTNGAPITSKQVYRPVVIAKLGGFADSTFSVDYNPDVGNRCISWTGSRGNLGQTR